MNQTVFVVICIMISICTFAFSKKPDPEIEYKHFRLKESLTTMHEDTLELKKEVMRIKSHFRKVKIEPMEVQIIDCSK